MIDSGREGFSLRLNQALDRIGAPAHGGGRQVWLAKLAGVTQAAARKWLTAEAMPSTRRIPELAARLGVRVEWLLYGDDGILREDATHYAAHCEPDSQPAPLAFKLAELEQGPLSRTDRELIDRLIESLREKYQDK